MSPLDEALHVQQAHRFEPACVICRLAAEGVRLHEIGAKVEHLALNGYHETIFCSPKWACHSEKQCAKLNGRCAFAPPAKGGEGDGR